MAWLFYLSGMHNTSHRGKVLILTYHRVLSREDLERRYVQPGMYVLDRVFDMQMQFVQKHFKILSFRDLLDRWRKKIWDHSDRYCVITFDDGWVDNYLHAYPILKKYGIHATIFLATDFIGTKQWFWPDRISYLLEDFCGDQVTREKKESLYRLLTKYSLRKMAFPHSGMALKSIEGDWAIDDFVEQCKQLSAQDISDLIEGMSTILQSDIPCERVLLNWEEVRQMSEDRIAFGSHSCTHTILTGLPLMEVKKEIEASRRTLLEKNVNYVPVFCYPNGNYNREIQRLVMASGYEAAVAASFGLEGEKPHDLFGIHRIGIHNDICSSVPLFSLRLLGPRI